MYVVHVVYLFVIEMLINLFCIQFYCIFNPMCKLNLHFTAIYRQFRKCDNGNIMSITISACLSIISSIS